MRVIVTAPGTEPTEPGTHVVDTVRYSGPLRVCLPARKTQPPHGLYILAQQLNQSYSNQQHYKTLKIKNITQRSKNPKKKKKNKKIEMGEIKIMKWTSKFCYLRVQFHPIQLADPPPNPDFFRTAPFFLLFFTEESRKKAAFFLQMILHKTEKKKVK